MNIVVIPETEDLSGSLSVEGEKVGIFGYRYGTGYWFYCIVPIHNMYGQNRIDEIQQAADNAIIVMSVTRRLRGKP